MQLALIILILTAARAFSQAKIGITGLVEWDTMRINAAVSLDLASANIKLPAGRIQGEALIASEYIRLIRPNLLNLLVDSASTIASLIERGEFSQIEVENIALQAKTVPPALSPDLLNLSESYSLGIAGISAALIRHSRPAELPRTLRPVTAPAYTGVIIVADESLPVHGMKSAAQPVPCLFPKIWDTDMNLIFERNMLNPRAGAMVRYASAAGLFNTSPSGLSPEIAAVVGDKPLRIFARSVFGIHPTDPVIAVEDALQIISSEDNRRLLREGKLVIILADSMLKSDLE